MSVKKILALLLAAMMVFGMTSAMADGPVHLNDPADTTMEIPITQTLYFKNADNSTVYEPNLTYTYEISPGTGDVNITDHAGVTVKVKPGDMRAFDVAADAKKTFEIKFDDGHATVAASSDGKSAVTKKVTVSFDGSKIVGDTVTVDDGNGGTTTVNVVKPGVYRYIITQTTSTADKNAKGVVEVGTQDKTLVLDVTVQNDGTVAGAVIQDPSTDDNPVVDNSGDGKTDATGKSTGFGGGDEDPDPTTDDDGGEDDPTTQTTSQWTAGNLPAYYDLYTTYDVTITKAVTGAMGDKSNFFPFQTDISDSIEGATISYSVTDNGSKNAAVAPAEIGADGAKTLGSATATVANGFEIKDGGKINLIGVPSKVTNNANVDVFVLANEYNNTQDKYTAKSADFDRSTAQDLAAGTSTTAWTDKFVKATFKDDTAETTFTVTNDLPEISPTGVVLRFAPFLAMFAAGCVLFLILATKRSKKEEE